MDYYERCFANLEYRLTVYHYVYLNRNNFETAETSCFYVKRAIDLNTSEGSLFSDHISLQMMTKDISVCKIKPSSIDRQVKIQENKFQLTLAFILA